MNIGQRAVDTVDDSPVATEGGSFSSLLGDIARRAEHILGREFAERGYDAELAALFGHHWSGWSH